MIIAVDFDGVIANYDGFELEEVEYCGEPVKGVQAALRVMKICGHTIVVNSCRSNVACMVEYMQEHKLPYDFINYSPRNVEQMLSPAKVAADIYIDDKAIPFKGDWAQTLKRIERFKVWYR